MIEKAVLNVGVKLASGTQAKKVYIANSNNDQYFMNNVIGELGELVFAKAVSLTGYKLGVDANSFAPFKRSDICDFFSSKTAITIDVKTTYKKNSNSLLVNKKISNWREIHSYVLVKLIADDLQNLDSIYELKEAEVLGSMTFRAINKPANEIFLGKDRSPDRLVYLINKDRLTPVRKLIENHFHKEKEPLERYYSENSLRLDIASIELGAVKECETNLEINERASYLREIKETLGNKNFVPYFSSSNNCVSFAIYKGQFHTSLFLKALLESEVRARKLKKTLVIPSYIENYVPEKDKEKLVNIIENLKCNVEYVWSNNKEYSIK